MEFLDLREPVSAWSHCAGMMLALPGILLLWRRSDNDRGERLTLLVYGLCLASCYLASTLSRRSTAGRVSLLSPAWTASGSSP